MSSNRKLRNEVIRSHFGLPGLRHERELKKAQAQALVQRVHLEGVLAAVLDKKGFKEWLRRRRLVRAIRELNATRASMQARRFALVNPSGATRPLVAAKPDILERLRLWLRARQAARLRRYYVKATS